MDTSKPNGLLFFVYFVGKNKQEIKKETLTIEIVYNAERKEYTECNINGEKINIDVEVIKQ